MPIYDIELDHPITISRGRTLREPFGFYADLDAGGVPVNPLDLTGFTFESHIRKNRSSSYPLVTEITVEIKDSDPTLGEIILTLTDTQTASIPVGEYLYDVMVTEGATGDKFNWVKGEVTVEGTVTSNV